MAKLHHSMIRVLDEARSAAFYQAAFGLKPCYRVDFDDFSLIYLRNEEDDFQLELTVNNGRTEPYDLGNGYGHLALNVADLDAEHERFKNLGFAPKDIKQFDQDGKKLARFFFVEDPDGYKIEVLERFGHFA
jgi:lactoylglutathione lyase